MALSYQKKARDKLDPVAEDCTRFSIQIRQDMEEKNEIVELSKNPDRAARLFDPTYVLLIITILIAAGFIFKLLSENAWLKTEIEKSSKIQSNPEALRVNDIIPTFKTVDINGNPAEIDYDGSNRFLFFIFSPSCHSCAEEIPKWNRIANIIQSKDYQIRGVSLDPLEETQKFFQDKDLQFQVLIMPNPYLVRAFRAVTIPEIIMGSPQGTVDWVHYGAMSEEVISELLSNVKSNSVNTDTNLKY